eukprot:362353-Chlamydomonas_euryale.AAC.7
MTGVLLHPCCWLGLHAPPATHFPPCTHRSACACCYWEATTTRPLSWRWQSCERRAQRRRRPAAACWRRSWRRHWPRECRRTAGRIHTWGCGYVELTLFVDCRPCATLDCTAPNLVSLLPSAAAASVPKLGPSPSLPPAAATEAAAARALRRETFCGRRCAAVSRTQRWAGPRQRACCRRWRLSACGRKCGPRRLLGRATWAASERLSWAT